MVTSENIAAADESGGGALEQNARAVSARLSRGRIVVRLANGAEFTFPPGLAQGLEHATPAQLQAIEISPSGLGLHFPALDVDLYLPALLEGVFGSRSWMAARLGQAGGQARSKAKVAAARANGRLGGRPRKPRTATAG